MQNQKIVNADNTMTMESGAISKKSQRSQRSRSQSQGQRSHGSKNSRNSRRSKRSAGSRGSKSMSSDGSLNKRKIKSNSALLNKQYQIMKGQGMFNQICFQNIYPHHYFILILEAFSNGIHLQGICLDQSFTQSLLLS